MNRSSSMAMSAVSTDSSSSVSEAKIRTGARPCVPTVSSKVHKRDGPRSQKKSCNNNRSTDTDLFLFENGKDAILTVGIPSLGDSLSDQFKQSLLSLLEFPPQGRAANGFPAHLCPQTLRCTTPESLDMQVVMWMRCSVLREVLSLVRGKSRNARGFH